VSKDIDKVDDISTEMMGKSIVFVSTVPYFMISQLSLQIKFFASLGMQVTIITSPGKELRDLPEDDAVCVLEVEIPRKLEAWADLKALWKLYAVFRQESFDIIHSFTPKAGLLCSVAAFFARIPLRFHTFTGQAWVTRKGLMRWVMRLSDRCISRLMTHCYADSVSQKEYLISEGIVSEQAISVIGNGSLGGIDLERFSLSRWSDDEKEMLKKHIGIEDALCVFIYIGRLTVDKGLCELLNAFAKLQQETQHAHLLLVGPTDPDGEAIFKRARRQENVHCLGYQKDVGRFLAVSDVFCLPSYREGFGTVVIEAAALGLPCVGTKISGLVDAVHDGVTGILVPVKDSERLYRAMHRLSKDKILRRKMGEAAQARAAKLYDVKVINTEWASEYVRWVKQ